MLVEPSMILQNVLTSVRVRNLEIGKREEGKWKKESGRGKTEVD